VHLFGQCADLEALRRIAVQYNIPLIEDNAQAIGATYCFANGQLAYAGTVGAVGTTSFFPAKNLGALGDGGALFTRDAARATYLRQLANHGQTRKYHHRYVGLNSRLDTLQAAFLNIKLPHLPAWTSARQRNADHYDAALGGISGLHLPHRDPQSSHVFHQYTLTLENAPQRDQLQEYLRHRGVPSMIYYPVPVHLQAAYAYLGYRAGQFPVAEHLCRTVLSLPVHPTLTTAQLGYIVTTIQAFFASERTSA
jgi:dTDP-4-amino-4,6-dideoxygalactose transaminase